MSSPSPSRMEPMTLQEQKEWLEKIRSESIYTSGRCRGLDGSGCFFRGTCRKTNDICPKRQEELLEQNTKILQSVNKHRKRSI